jgi:hypothetical protein
MYRSDRVTALSGHVKSLLATDRSRPAGKHGAAFKNSLALKNSAAFKNSAATKHRAAKRAVAAIGPKRAVVLAGTALALAGAGTASAATIGGASGTAALPAAAPGSARVLTAGLTSTRAPHVTAQPEALHTAPTHAAASHAAPSQPAPLTWLQIRNKIIEETSGPGGLQGSLPYSDRLMPVGTSGQQAFMPISQAQYQNATTIVQQAFAKKMGIQSAVVAVATAMQESQLQNINYGDQDSLGLFQQQPDCGWGTPQQILDPTYAADAFLDALGQYQAQNPSWAQQPLWANAQAVQQSGFPFAYAQWEMQAAGLVKQIATQMVTSQQ